MLQFSVLAICEKAFISKFNKHKVQTIANEEKSQGRYSNVVTL